MTGSVLTILLLGSASAGWERTPYPEVLREAAPPEVDRALAALAREAETLLREGVRFDVVLEGADTSTYRRVIR